jgi:hypothetical protein
MRRTKNGQKKLPIKIKKLALAAVILAPFLFPLAVAADNVVEGFSSTQPLQPGEVVAIDKAADRSVKVAPADNANLIYGVVVDPSDAPITLVGQNSQVFVATTGTYPVLVSANGGTIHPGDYISMSNINGIAGKAQVGQALVLGKSQSSFDGKAAVVSSEGGVKIGRVYVSIGITKNPIVSTDPTVPAYLRKVANSVANRSVPVIRVYTALVIFAIAMASAIVILWSGVRSSMISLGRNPLSRHAIFSGMYKVLVTGIGVFIIGLAGVYLLLKV